MSATLRSFPSADSLSAFHAGRMGLYRALFELLRRPPSESTWDAARRAVVDSAARDAAPQVHRTVMERLAASDAAAAAGEYGELFLGPRAIPMRCAQPRCGVREAAFTAAEALPTEERTGEVQVLSTLAARTCEALRAGQLARASALSDLQGRFLVHHAAACQRTFSRALRESGAPFFGPIGEALGALVEDDLRLLG